MFIDRSQQFIGCPTGFGDDLRIFECITVFSKQADRLIREIFSRLNTFSNCIRIPET